MRSPSHSGAALVEPIEAEPASAPPSSVTCPSLPIRSRPSPSTSRSSGGPIRPARARSSAGAAFPACSSSDPRTRHRGSGRELEDWIREPVRDAELVIRAVTVARRADAHCDPASTAAGRSASAAAPSCCPMSQRPIVARLLERPGEVVSDAEICALFRPRRASTHAEAVKTALRRIKDALAPLGLRLTRVRAAGYLLDRVPVATPGSSSGSRHKEQVLTCSLGRTRGGTHAPHARTPRKPVAVVTGASQGLGLALAEALADRGLGARDRRPAGRPARRRGGPPRVAHRCRRRWPATSPTPRTARRSPTRPRALGTVRLVVNNASTLGASPLPPLDRIAPRSCATPSTTNVDRAHRAVAGARAGAGRRRDHREHHVRRRGRGVRRVGRVRRVEGGARARAAGSSRSSSRRAGCSSSTPATCAPRCTRTRSRARTSPIDPSRPRAFPASSPSSRATSPSGRYEARAFTPAASRQP